MRLACRMASRARWRRFLSLLCQGGEAGGPLVRRRGVMKKWDVRWSPITHKAKEVSAVERSSRLGAGNAKRFFPPRDGVSAEMARMALPSGEGERRRSA